MVLLLIADKSPEFFQALGIIKQAVSVMEDPQDVIDLPDAVDLVVKQGEIVFDNVSFCYGERQVFQNKNLRISAGERVGLVGYSGTGKSTFVNLILRFFSIEQGRILIDGQNIASVTSESLRRQIALIPQDPILFHRSLEDNIKAKNCHCSSYATQSTDSHPR